MAWFGDGLSSLSNLKGQITSFTKEVLSEGIVEETDERTRQLNEANERCVQLQEVLNSKDAEISLLRRQNCELQKAVVELNAKPRESNDANSLDDDGGGGGFFWDPPPVKNRDVAIENPERASILQERLSQATRRIRELEDELRLYKSSANERKDEINDANRKAELLRLVVNQIGKMRHDAEINFNRQPLDETTDGIDLQTALWKLDPHEQTEMLECIRRALIAEKHHDEVISNEEIETSDVDEKREKLVRPRLESISLLSHTDDTDHNGIAENGNSTSDSYREIENLRERIRELQRENEFLTTSLDELDKEHAQSLDAILLIKDQLGKKHELLQHAYEQLYVECNEAQTKLQLLEGKTISGVEANNNRISENSTISTTREIINEEKEVQTEALMSETKVKTTIHSENKNVQTEMTLESIEEKHDSNEQRSSVDELTKRVNKILKTETEASKTSVATVQTAEIPSEDKYIQTEMTAESIEENHKSNEQRSILDDLTKRINEILKNSPIESHNDENSIFETLANNYVEANWKKEMLERKLTEITRELKQTAEMRDSLQLECDDMQTNIESLLLQIEHLKSNLPSIPEASEERVASLEIETESMSEEIKKLRSEHEALKTKHFELITATSILEGTLRNQENLEAELRNTRQQLDIAKQQLDGASKNFENNENMMEDLSRRLHASLEENNELRKRLDSREIAEKRINEQLRVSQEIAKNVTFNEETIDRLKHELDDNTRELNESRTSVKRLENELYLATELRNELERDITAISHEKEHLEAELLVLRENASEKETSDLMKNLREQLDTAKRDKDDLEYDILNMRKELDEALEHLSTTESELSKLSFDNERLVKENDELMEQLSINHDDTTERIELLQTEMNLLAQEHTALKDESTIEKAEISKLRKELDESLAKRAILDNELSTTLSKLEAVKSERKELQIRTERIVVLEDEVNRLKSLENELRQAEEKSKLLENELTNLRSIEEESKLLKETCSTLEARSNEAKNVETKLAEITKKCDELETLIECLQSEKNEREVSNNEDSRIIVELRESLANLETSLERANENATMAKETIESLSKLVGEKDREIETLKLAALTSAENKHSEEESALKKLTLEREEFVRLVQEKHNTNLQYYAEIQRLAQLIAEQETNLQRVIAERDEKTTELTGKEGEILWAQNELKVVRQRLKSLEESQNYGETCGIVEHSVQIAQSMILNEKCKALEAALIKEQSSNRNLQNQLTESQSRENNAAKELERLRTHLVEMEASYTEEALIAEENRKQLEIKLLQAEEKAQNSLTVYTSASIRANQQVETLQQQMALIVQQRDEIQMKLSTAEDKVLSHSASLTNLQIVLEQFQRDKENDIRTATEKIRQQLNMSYKEQEDLRNEIVNLRTQLSEAKECLQAASRLSEQLDKKSERIEELNQEVASLTELVNTADQRIQEATSNEEGKVDKNLVKNLLLGFLTSSTMDKSSVLRVFATVLEFDESEREKIGLNHPAANSGWFSGLLGSGNAPTKDQEASLSAAFVRFLESESKPKPQLPALTISNSSLSRPGHSRQHSSSSTQSGLLLSNITLPSFPDFVPSRNTGSILKEVLKDS